jgi:hypothetical protein
MNPFERIILAACRTVADAIGDAGTEASDTEKTYTGQFNTLMTVPNSPYYLSACEQMVERLARGLSGGGKCRWSVQGQELTVSLSVDDRFTKTDCRNLMELHKMLKGGADILVADNKKTNKK